MKRLKRFSAMMAFATVLLLTLAIPAFAGEEAGGSVENATLVFLIFILVISIFLGVELISKVPSLLHTPLMSGSNAISGITVLGSMVAAGLGDNFHTSALLGAFAVGFAMINVVGGYLVTDRMLLMFKRKTDKSGGTK